LPSKSFTAVVGTVTVYFLLPENITHDQYTYNILLFSASVV
jgi:hypothetical protein